MITIGHGFLNSNQKLRVVFGMMTVLDIVLRLLCLNLMEIGRLPWLRDRIMRWLKKILRKSINVNVESVNPDCRFAVVTVDEKIDKSNLEDLNKIFKDSDLFMGVKSTVLPKGMKIQFLSDDQLQEVGLMRVEKGIKHKWLVK